ncbi:MAG: DUF4097 family beta strand repeat-containing protein [Bacteroidota bacterium]|nr:DUF4097 family beta strand repeat-containing protein [Bacteroidota bacterium]
MRSFLKPLSFAVLLLIAAPVSAQDKLTPISEKFSANQVENLMLSVVDADVTVNTSDASSVTVDVIVESRDTNKAMEYYEKQNFSVSLEGGTLHVVSKPDKNYRGPSNWRNSVDIHVMINMPPGVHSSIRTSDGDLAIEELTSGAQIRTSDGDINIGQISGGDIVIQTSDGSIAADLLQGPSVSIRTSDGDLMLGKLIGNTIRAQTSDGDIKIETVSGEFEARTSDGDLSISNMTSSRAVAQTSDGDIRIGNVSGTLTVSSSDGDVELELVDPGDISVSVGDGDTLVSIPADISTTLDVRASDGDVDMDAFSNFSGNIEDSRVTGDLNGGGPMIRVRTSDGDAVMRSFHVKKLHIRAPQLNGN